MKELGGIRVVLRAYRFDKFGTKNGEKLEIIVSPWALGMLKVCFWPLPFKTRIQEHTLLHELNINVAYLFIVCLKSSMKLIFTKN